MKTRKVAIIATGERFTVPQGIQRLDSTSTRGWQVRYQGTKYFADGAEGAKKSLERATRELLHRIATMPAPVTLRRASSPSKRSTVPVGISGPILVTKATSSLRSAVLSVLLPRFGKTNQIKRVHIGTEYTYTRARFKAALVKAIELRAAALAQYEAAATKAKRKEAVAMKQSLAAKQRRT